MISLGAPVLTAMFAPRSSGKPREAAETVKGPPVPRSRGAFESRDSVPKIRDFSSRARRTDRRGSAAAPSIGSTRTLELFQRRRVSGLRLGRRASSTREDRVGRALFVSRSINCGEREKMRDPFALFALRSRGSARMTPRLISFLPSSIIFSAVARVIFAIK